MNYDQLAELVSSRISDLVDQLVRLQEQGDEVNMAIVNDEIRKLTAAMDSEDATDNFFYATDYKHLV